MAESGLKRWMATSACDLNVLKRSTQASQCDAEERTSRCGAEQRTSLLSALRNLYTASSAQGMGVGLEPTAPFWQQRTLEHSSGRAPADSTVTDASFV